MFGQGVLPGRTLSGSDQLWTAAPWAASAPVLSQPAGANPELFDATLQFEPFADYTRERLPDPPLWNPYIMGGRPYLANAQSAVLSPFNVASYAVPRRVAPAVSAMLKVLAAAFGTFLLARALGAGFAGALLAGLVYGFGQFTVAWVSWPEDGVRVLLPWLLLLADLVVRRPRALPVAGLAAVVAAQFFGGHPETSYYVLGATTAFALFRMFELHRGGTPVLRPALSLAGALVLGTALAAVVILPFVELLRGSSDLVSRELIPARRLPRNHLLGMLLPDYWGRPTQTPPLSFTLTPSRALYAGALPLMLAGAALLLRSSLRRWVVALLGASALAVLFGLEPFWTLADALPGPVRTDRLFFLVLLVIALLAGGGLDDLAARVRPRRWVLGLSATIACVPLVYVAVFDRPALEDLGPALELAVGLSTPPEALAPGSRADVIHAAALLEWLAFAGAAVGLLALRVQRRLAVPAFVVLALLLTAGDLFKIGMGYNPATPIAHARQPATGAIRYLQQRRPARFAAVDPGSFIPTSLPANVAMRYGLSDARGYDFPVVKRFTEVWTRNIAPVLPDPRFTLPVPDARSRRALGLMSVAYLLQDRRSPALRDPALELVYDQPDARIYRNRDALPRAFVVARQQVAANPERALAAVEAPGFDGRATAITEQRVPGVSTAERAAGGSATIAGYAPERVTIRAAADRPSLLVLTDAFFAGWKADLDGEAAQIYRVDYLSRGIRLPAGAHTVTFAYRPASFTAGWIVSLLALVALAALAATGLAARSRRTDRVLR
jgi:hypothetical protein